MSESEKSGQLAYELNNYRVLRSHVVHLITEHCKSIEAERCMQEMLAELDGQLLDRLVRQFGFSSEQADGVYWAEETRNRDCADPTI